LIRVLRRRMVKDGEREADFFVNRPIGRLAFPGREKPRNCREWRIVPQQL
jgi:hypothetical protein